MIRGNVAHILQRKIQLFTIFGAGLLVGTALAVIIPEGVDAMYSQANTQQSTGKNKQFRFKYISFSFIYLVWHDPNEK